MITVRDSPEPSERGGGPAQEDGDGDYSEVRALTLTLTLTCLVHERNSHSAPGPQACQARLSRVDTGTRRYPDGPTGGNPINNGERGEGGGSPPITAQEVPSLPFFLAATLIL